MDGRSGSGKTELAAAIAAGWPAAQLVRLDDIYPGWDGLAAGSARVPEILRSSRWQEWDWTTLALGAWHVLDSDRPLIVEGVGAVSAASIPLADFSIWVDLDDAERKRRAIDRDGDVFAEHWDEWAAQEVRFIESEHPRDRVADIVSGTDTARAAAQWLSKLPAASMGV